MLNKEEILEKKKILENALTTLKQKYSGIDSVIDNIGVKIETWWLTDNLLYAPPVITLWGMTGTGKTQLVNDLARLLGISKNYVEVDTSRTSTGMADRRQSHGRGKTFEDKIGPTFMNSSVKGIIVLDEIHKRDMTAMDGIWKFLSSGRLSNDNYILNRIDDVIEEIHELFDEYAKNEMLKSRKEQNGKRVTSLFGEPQDTGPKNPWDNTGGGSSNWENTPATLSNPYTESVATKGFNSWLITYAIRVAEVTSIEDMESVLLYHEYSGNPNSMGLGVRSHVKKLLDDGMEPKDILNSPGMPFWIPIIDLLERKKASYLEKFKVVSGRDPLVLNRALVFVISNIDELYHFEGAEKLTADQLCAATKKFTEKDLREVVLENKIFRNEEFGRLGNHIIYPSIDEKGFRRAIKQKLTQIEIDTFEETGIEIKLSDKASIDRIYRECVIPTQGIRPLISSIYRAVGEIIPKMVMEHLNIK